MKSASTSMPKQKSPLEQALGTISSEFRSKIVKSYLELKARHREDKHEPAGMAAGRLCECVLRLLQQQLTQTFVPFGQPLPQFAQECEKLIGLPKATGNESQRGRDSFARYHFSIRRNKRGIGHVGGDIDANAIDGATIARLGDWIMCELIRIHHNLSLEDADALVGSLSSRDIPRYREIGGKKRVLRNDLDFKQKTLLLLYSDTNAAVFVEDLVNWTKYTNLSVYKTNVIGILDRENLVEYDTELQSVTISPLGIREVEEKILPWKSRSGPRLPPECDPHPAELKARL